MFGDLAALGELFGVLREGKGINGDHVGVDLGEGAFVHGVLDPLIGGDTMVMPALRADFQIPLEVLGVEDRAALLTLRKGALRHRRNRIRETVVRKSIRGGSRRRLASGIVMSRSASKPIRHL
jgi:hypothetical protein